MDNLENLSRKELQALAKSNGVKANLSNADIITKLQEIRDAQVHVPEPEQATVEEPVKEEVERILEASMITPEVTIAEEKIQIEKSEVQAAEVTVVPAEKELEVGDNIEAQINETWVAAVIKRLNKKTVRVRTEGGVEHTVQFDDIRTVAAAAPASETAAEPMEVVGEESIAAVEAPVVEMGESVIEHAVTEEAPLTVPAVGTVEEVQQEESAPEVAAAEPTAVEPEVEVIMAAPASPNVAAVERSVPPTPVSLAASSVGWNSCTKFSLPMQDSAVKTVGGKRRERRNAGRSTIQHLVDSMKQEIECEGTSVEVLEAEAESPAKEAIAAEPLVAEPIAAAPAVEQAAPVAVAPVAAAPVAVAPVAAVPVAVAPVAVAPVAVAPVAVAPVAVAPTPASTTASASAVPASAASAKDMLPRMTKAQVMRLDANQKKIVTIDTAPAPSAAFTIAAKAPTPAPTAQSVARPTVAHTSSHTPSHYRNSISTSAPSSAALHLHQAHSQQRPKLTTPTASSASSAFSAQPGRLSMQVQVSGTKRKVTDSMERDRSSSANAPDFKRMHNKQFTALKSIAECVDQDKKVGVRMTIAMENALGHAAPTPSVVAPFKPLHSASSAKPAPNPFSSVINRSTSNTPSKLKSASATPAMVSRPVPTSSGNIIKSRTVTSFMPAGASSCGNGNGKVNSCGKVTSFVNNENAGPGSSNVTSFLKSRESGSASFHKHRSVVVSNGGSTMNHGATKQKLQMF